PHHCCQWEEQCSIIGVSGGRNSAPLLVSVGGGIVPHRWYQCGGGGIVPRHWCQWGKGIVSQHWCQWEE
ncbi:unnamed protein product, partial [Staurois parvus]